MRFPTIECPVSRLHELLYVDETAFGALRNRVDRGGKGGSGGKSKAFAGEPSARKGPHGYLTVNIDGRRYLAHRVVFAMTNGRWPLHEIDHIDRDRTNNRPENLREVTHWQNHGNKKPGKSGVRGVFYVTPKDSKPYWMSLLNRRYLGVFQTLDEAKTAYDTAATQQYGIGVSA